MIKYQNLLHVLLVISFGFGLIVLLLVLVDLYYSQQNNDEYIFGVVAISSACFLVLTYQFIVNANSNAQFSGAAVFLVFSYYFNFSYLLLYYFNLSPINWILFWSWEYAAKSSMIALYFFMASCIGIILGIKSFQYKKINISNWDVDYLRVAKIGALFVYIGFFAVVIFILMVGKDIFSRSYDHLIYTEGRSIENGIFFAGDLLIKSGIIISCVGSSVCFKRLFVNKLVMLTIAGYLIFLMTQGDRGGAFHIIILLLAIRSYLIRSFALRTVLAMVFISLILISGLRYARYSEERNITSMISYLNSSQVEYGVIDALENGGFTFTVLNRTVAMIDNGEDYWVGKSIVYALIRLAPFSGELVSSSWNPDTWVTSSTDPQRFEKGGGLGFSFFAEAYLNFGLIGGAIFIFMFSLVIGKSLIGTKHAQYTNELVVRVFFELWLILFIVMVVRGSISVPSRFVIYGLLLNYMAIILSRRPIKKLN